MVHIVYKVSEPTCRELSAWVEPFYMVSKPTSKGLLAGNAACSTCSEPTPRRMSLGGGRGVILSLPFPTLPLGDRWLGVETVYKVKNPLPGE